MDRQQKNDEEALFYDIKGIIAAHFVTEVTKRAAMPARFVTTEVVTNRAGIAPIISLGYQYM